MRSANPVYLYKYCVYVQCPGKIAHAESPLDDSAVVRLPACAAQRVEVCEQAAGSAEGLDLISAIRLVARDDG